MDITQDMKKKLQSWKFNPAMNATDIVSAGCEYTLFDKVASDMLSYGIGFEKSFETAYNFLLEREKWMGQ